MIKTVRELIKALAEFNPDAKIFIGDNLNNHVTLSWGGPEGCNKENCEDVGFQIEGEENGEQPSSSEPDLEQEHRFYGETIVITDPCYLKKTAPLMKTSTIYGDWSCMVYPGRMETNEDFEEWDKKYFKFYADYNQETDEEQKKIMFNDWKWFKRRWKEERTLGEFCADAGNVGVFEWDALTNEEKEWVKTHDWCAAVIENVDGWVGFKTISVDEEITRHVVCVGKTNFFTMQSGL